MKNSRVLPTYPGFTRRALTFTIDDGRIQYDKRFIECVKPHGIKGTFNLCAHSMDYEDAFYRELYSGFGIANHTNFHPYAMDDALEYLYLDEPYGEQEPDPVRLYPSNRGKGFYMKRFTHGWRELADNDTYRECVSTCQERLEHIFGRETVTGFVWPYSEQNNSEIKQFLIATGFKSVRKTGDVLDTTDFALPADRMAWSYNANNRNFLSVMEKYEQAEDNGTLRFFAFGVHSWDFERDGNWQDLATFAEKYGDRPSDYWYATVDEIFAYADAMAELTVTATEVKNPTAIPLYVELDGKRLTIPPHSSVEL